MYSVITLTKNFMGHPDSNKGRVDTFNLRGHLELRQALEELSLDAKIHHLLELDWEPFSVDTKTAQVASMTSNFDVPITTWYFKKYFKEG